MAGVRRRARDPVAGVAPAAQDAERGAGEQPRYHPPLTMDATSSSSMPGTERLRVGIDLVQISRIRESIDAFGERFAQRLFTPQEIAYASAEEALAAERF